MQLVWSSEVVQRSAIVRRACSSRNTADYEVIHRGRLDGFVYFDCRLSTTLLLDLDKDNGSISIEKTNRFHALAQDGRSEY